MEAAERPGLPASLTSMLQLFAFIWYSFEPKSIAALRLFRGAWTAATRLIGASRFDFAVVDSGLIHFHPMCRTAVAVDAGLRSSGGGSETGLALSDVPRAVPASQLFNQPKQRHTVPIRAFSDCRLDELPNGRPRRYVQYSSGPLDHYSSHSP
ncbi:hypothetical protein QN224_25275 [Sinorhizobium sp. 8-89]|uniref:hypothetical protein n=1 Tax=Sinorhizobium sp. 7-81 TaxID=3049087 RepID=UPI0024C3E678|nr:hypothetical protein [Sinorhizobium sp. 7-81]MDK1388725.1 hypothetical protein [Sinorhizobium sp. 7-81]